MCIPVVVPEFDVSPGLQDLPVLQPGELGLRLALGLASEYGSGADRPGDGLRRLDELCRSWEKKKKRTHQMYSGTENKDEKCDVIVIY